MGVDVGRQPRNVEHIGYECLDQHMPSGLGVDATSEEVEQGCIVQVADSCAVAALDLIGVDLQLRPG
jgi:hypothetical protein